MEKATERFSQNLKLVSLSQMKMRLRGKDAMNKYIGVK